MILSTIFIMSMPFTGPQYYPDSTQLQKPEMRLKSHKEEEIEKFEKEKRKKEVDAAIGAL